MPDDTNQDAWVNMGASQHPTLAEGEIHIWRIALDAATDVQNAGILSPDEHERAARLKIPTVKTRFVAGRIALRQILARYLGITPSDIRFQYTPYGKPEISAANGASEGNDLRFNLAHSESLALLAVCRNQPIGIDLEHVRHLTKSETEYITNSAFTPAEREALAQLSDAAYLSAFFRCWTRKEAVMKAHGAGFRLAQTFNVTMDDTPKIIEADEFVGLNWTLLDIPIDDPYVAALATAVKTSSLRLFYFI